MSSISSVKNSPASAIKISAVILNLASDKPDSDKKRKRYCVTIKQTVIQAGRLVKKNTSLQKISDVHKHDSVWPSSIYQYSDMAQRLSGKKKFF